MSGTMENLPPVQPSAFVPQTSTMAIVSLVMGILSWFLLPVIGGILAIITGYISRKEIKNTPGQFTGDGMAIAGMVLGITNIVFVVLFGICWLGMMVFVMRGVGSGQ